MRMFRRLLEASTRAASGQPGSILQVTPTPLLPHNPAAILTGPAVASSSSSPGLAAVAAAAGGPAAASHDSTQPPQQRHINSTLQFNESSDELEYSILAAFSDMETVFLACISTLLPLVVALGLAFGIRHVWRKYRERRTSTSSGLPWYRGVNSRDDTAESLRSGGAVCSQQQQHQQQSSTQILSAQNLVNGMDGTRYICESEMMEDEVGGLGRGCGGSNNVEFTSAGSLTSKNANGNIITLTLKNNHLIVETEERAVTMEDTRVGKYQDNGCSVIVEVPPGYQDEASANINKIATADQQQQQQQREAGARAYREETSAARSTSAFDNSKLFGSCNTGLSQSDLSICSEGSANPSYRYGNQLEYEAGHFGYPMYDSAAGGARNSAAAAVGCCYEQLIPTTHIASSTSWLEFDKSPDTEKTLLEDSKTPSMEKDMDRNTLDKTIREDLPMDSSSSIDNQLDNLTDLSDSGNNANVQSSANPCDNNISAKLELQSLNKPVITGAILKDEMNLLHHHQDDTIQEQQRRLGNGTLIPDSEATNLDKNDRQQQQQQNNGTLKPEGSNFVPAHKRTDSIPPRLSVETSLECSNKKPTPQPPPLDIYSQIKTSILPGLSPKFELLQNEVCNSVDEKES